MASSVELGPGMMLASPNRSRKRSSLTHLRLVTSSRRIIAICAAGPPKAVKPKVRKTTATSFSREDSCSVDADVTVLFHLFRDSCGGTLFAEYTPAPAATFCPLAYDIHVKGPTPSPSA